MKRSIWLSCIIILVVIFLGVIYWQFDKVNIGFVSEAEVRFLYGNTDILHHLSDQEVESLKAIFNKKRMYKDNLSCGFSEAVSVKFNQEHTFCIALDACPIIYWKEKNRYIKISEDEKTQLYDLLEPYGFFFPCV
ncbi:MAG: hypothetical protein IJ351_02575 [Oscillospiraceae bacterium]|nr:hypothetical protein [Oscillospiraceae bacterium]